MIKAVVFDFDGLIVDTESPWFYAVRELYADHDHDISLDLYARCIGSSLETFDPYAHLAALLETPAVRQKLVEQATIKHQRFMENVELRPGVKDYLTAAQELGLKVGLASSSHRKWIDPFLTRFGIADCFDCKRTADDVERVKPAPDLYIAAAACLGVEPHEAVAFEDSLNGLVAARAAGLHCIVVPNEVTGHLPFEGHRARLGSMAERPLQELVRLLEEEN